MISALIRYVIDYLFPTTKIVHSRKYFVKVREYKVLVLIQPTETERGRNSSCTKINTQHVIFEAS